MLRCKHCGRKYRKQPSGTSTLLKHLRNCPKLPADTKQGLEPSPELKQTELPVISKDLWLDRVKKVKAMVVCGLSKLVSLLHILKMY